jgi:protein-S-isoprenylcysteine O-methyltransferase Ste14
VTGGSARLNAPRVLLVVGVGVLVAALVRQAAGLGRPPHALAFTLTLVYLGWLLAEARVTLAPRVESTPDDPTLVPYALARFGTVAAAVLGPLPWVRWAWWMALPVAAFAGGVALRLWAIRTLGRFYSHRVVHHQEHRVVATGPYAWVRHPAYAGMLGAHLGFVAFFLNGYSVAGLALLAAAIAVRIRVEDRMLATVPDYPEYAAGRAGLVPGVW